MSKKKALGRGLNALLSDSNIEERLEVDIPISSGTTASPSGGTLEISIEHIEVNPFQPPLPFRSGSTARTCRVN
jgi:hypothetical protein